MLNLSQLPLEQYVDFHWKTRGSYLYTYNVIEVLMKKQYTIIVLILIWTAVMIAKPIIESLPNQAQREYEAYMREMSDKSRAVEAQFNDAITYFKEHEEDFMKVSELFLEQYYEGITP